MYPTLFHLPILNIPIYGYGLMMVFSFLGCQWLAGRLARAKGLDPEVFINCTLLALVAGVIGCRMSHVLENLSDYTRSPSFWQNAWSMVNIRSGGLTFYGGLILAAPVVIAYFVHHKVPLRTALDISAPCVTLGLAIGRIGCLLNGCCYGADANVPWALSFPYGSNAYVDQFTGATGERLNHEVPPQLLVHLSDGNLRLKTADELKGSPDLQALAASERSNPVHPTQLYSTFNSLLMTGLLIAYFFTPHVAGRTFAWMLILEGPTRFLLELLRIEPPVLGPMSLSMVIGVALFVVGIGLWFVMGWLDQPRGTSTGFGMLQPA